VQVQFRVVLTVLGLFFLNATAEATLVKAVS
jgi:hypothetical protein